MDKVDIFSLLQQVKDFNIRYELFEKLKKRSEARHLNLAIYKGHEEYRIYHKHLIKMLEAKPDAKILEVGPALWGLKAAKQLAEALKLQDLIRNWSFCEMPENMSTAYISDDISADELNNLYFDSEEYSFLESYGASYHNNGLERLNEENKYDLVTIAHGYKWDFTWLKSDHLVKLLSPGGFFLSIGYADSATHAEDNNIEEHPLLQITTIGRSPILFKVSKLEN